MPWLGVRGGRSHGHPLICLQFLRMEERESGSPHTGPEALKKGPLFVKKVEAEHSPTAPWQEGGPARPPQALAPAPPGTKHVPRIPTATSNSSAAATPPVPRGPAGKDGARGVSGPTGEKSSATTFLTVPGPHSPGPIKSPRPTERPASPFVWPPKRLAPSVASLSSLASSCFDLAGSLSAEYAPSASPSLEPLREHVPGRRRGRSIPSLSTKFCFVTRGLRESPGRGEPRQRSVARVGRPRGRKAV